MIKWKFKQTEVFFLSEPQNLLRDVFKNARRVGVDPKQKIEIYNDLFTNLELDATDLTGWDGTSDLKNLQTLSVDAEKVEVKTDEASGLQPMSDVLGELRSPLTALGNISANGSPGKSNGRVSGKRS